MKGAPSHCMAASNPESSSKVNCKEISVSEKSLCQDLDWKKLNVAKFLSGFTIAISLVDVKASTDDEDPEEEEVSKEEEDPEEEEDPKEFPTED
ncbi:hypothetical protein FNV43_RR04518 [Rhamnella rubrinervis]|uniref:Uncharacterized protein n=1 Tax=Rhamnella rubrinervis TaxID=2594499 RepID=A0A8K0MPM5_9ROSA|nr:hypothetical protein FNV43_RR04518 [Rhamnella rubrinervis]